MNRCVTYSFFPVFVFFFWDFIQRNWLMTKKKGKKIRLKRTEWNKSCLKFMNNEIGTSFLFLFLLIFIYNPKLLFVKCAREHKCLIRIITLDEPPGFSKLHLSFFFFGH